MNRRLTAVIVDDERLARADLRRLLAAFPDIEVVGEAEDLTQTAALVQRTQPDVIFLDIQLRGESGFELFDRVQVAARVIFVTAHDAHALRAFEVNALDYLLKPVAPDRLAASLERLRSRPGVGGSRRLEIGDFLFVPMNGRPCFLKVNQIVAVSAAGDATVVALADGTRARVPRALKMWEERLPERFFVRIHREAIVNLQHVERVVEWSNASYHVHLHGWREPLTLSRRFAARLKARFA